MLDTPVVNPLWSHHSINSLMVTGSAPVDSHRGSRSIHRR